MIQCQLYKNRSEELIYEKQGSFFYEMAGVYRVVYGSRGSYGICAGNTRVDG